MVWVSASYDLIFTQNNKAYKEKMKLFVYYKFLPDSYPALKMHVLQMQIKLQKQFPQLKAQVMKRPTPDELGQVTWMEIYDLETSDFSVFTPELDRAVEQEKLPHPRRTEQFVDC
jgi:hypothetical protein